MSLTQTYIRLEARYVGQGKALPAMHGMTLPERVTAMAEGLGAQQPYAVVLFPEYLPQIISNTEPAWIDVGNPFSEE